jgi:O-antigen ligase
MIRKLLLWLTFAGVFWPVWLWRVMLDERPIFWAFNSLVVYLPEVFGLLLVAATLLESRILKRAWRWGDRPLTAILIAFASLGTLSALWALEARLALWTAAEWWLVVGVYLSVVNSGERSPAWRALAPLALLLLGVEAAAGAAQVGTGSTLTGRLLLRWETDLRIWEAGASYLMNAAGQPLLRAYGTTEHPNHLGGYTGVLALILLGAWLIESNRPRQWRWAGGLAAAVALLGLTFSRGGGIAFALAASYLLLCSLRKPGRVIAAVGLMGGVAVIFVLLFGSWVIQRVAPPEDAWLEMNSLRTRALIAQGAWDLFRERPLLGVGLGNYMQGAFSFLSAQVKVPVHNTMALAASELGLAGGLLVVGLYARVIWAAWQARKDLAAAVGVALLLALLVANAFDLYAWGLAPGRLLLGLLCGLCASDLAAVDSKFT